MNTVRSRRPQRRSAVAATLALLALLLPSPVALADEPAAYPLDPAHNLALPCEALSTPGLVPRSARNLAHVANLCGFVGTDVEFQSRTAADGTTRDFAFLGTMGAGLRIFDITDPAHPFSAGGYTDPGWENDIQVRGDLAVIGFDPLSAAHPTASACLQAKGAAGGVDIVRLSFDPASATFTTALLGCVDNDPGGGAHNSTLHPSGEWLAMINPRGHGSVDVVDLRGTPRRLYRLVQSGSLASSACTGLPAGVRCVSIGRSGTWSPHDVSFSRDGRTAYVAAVGNDTVIIDVSRVLEGAASVISVVPNLHEPGGLANSHNIEISHQADTSSDGRILMITDERGGGLDNTDCNTDPDGVIGGMGFWALAPIAGQAATADASPATPRKLGTWSYPDPVLLPDPLAPALAAAGRLERGCTIHVFRPGGNGTAGPGEIAPGYGGVSSLPGRQLVVAHYGAGTWWLDFSAPPRSDDGVAEDPRASWGNALGWNVMPGADTWSAKEYKGFVYTGDMARGFDVFSFTSCADAGCVVRPTSTPGRAGGGGQLEGELAEFTILRGTTVGGRAQLGFDVSYMTGAAAPTGSLHFRDRTNGTRVEATAIDSLTIEGPRATITGRATVDGVAGVAFVAEVEDLGRAGADTFRIVTATGYGAFGVLEAGNITVEGGGLLGTSL